MSTMLPQLFLKITMSVRIFGNLQKQQVPNPMAQEPLASPPDPMHSLKYKKGFGSGCIARVRFLGKLKSGLLSKNY